MKGLDVLQMATMEEKIMPNFDALNDEQIKVQIVTLNSVEDVEVTSTTTVKELKARLGITNAKLIDEDSNLLRDNDTLEEGMQIYVSTPKKNG